MMSIPNQEQARRDLISDIPEAAYYLDRFDSQVDTNGNHSLITMKVGGGIFDDPTSREQLTDSVSRLSELGFYPVIVHGAGTQIDDAYEAANIPIRRTDGLRHTPVKAIGAVSEVLAGINQQLVNDLQARGTNAMGLKNSLTADYIDQSVHGEVGVVTGVNRARITELTRDGIVPVMWCLGETMVGSTTKLLNINGDDAAASVATALRPEKYLSITPSGGILDKDSNLLHMVSPDKAQELMEQGVITDGMKKKVNELLHLFGTGAVRDAVMLKPQYIIQELFTHEGHGTLVTSSADMSQYSTENFAGVSTDKLTRLIEDSFDGKLQDGYFDHINLKKAVVTAQRYDGVGIVLHPDNEKLVANDIGYLDKLAVATNARGRGVAQQILETATNGSGLFWRASPGSQYRNRYEDFADGSLMVTDEAGKWHVFWKNVPEELIPDAVTYAQSRPVTLTKNV